VSELGIGHLCSSEYTKSELKKIHGDSIGSRVQITPGWTDIERFRPAASKRSAKLQLEWPVDRPVFFSLRRLVPRMGMDRLVAAAALVRQQGLTFQLYIGGKGPLQQSLQQQIADLHLADCVQLVGAVSEEQLSLMYALRTLF